jgi:hypothetical protein
MVRIDKSMLRRPPSQVLNSLLIDYEAVVGGQSVLVEACINGAATPGGVPCVLEKFCYKNNEMTVDLRADCELVFLSEKNGRLLIR